MEKQVTFQHVPRPTCLLHVPFSPLSAQMVSARPAQLPSSRLSGSQDRAAREPSWPGCLEAGKQLGCLGLLGLDEMVLP